MIEKIVSGGQTGADRGGLDAAIYAGLPHGGWCPKGRRAEDGVIPVKYQLHEMLYRDYLKRTEANVVDSDFTVIFGYGRPARGSKHTIGFCEGHNRPYLYIDFAVHQEEAAIAYIVAWLNALDGDGAACVINVAGSRESGHRGIHEKVLRVMVNVLHDINGKGPILYPQTEDHMGPAIIPKDDGSDAGYKLKKKKKD